MSTRFLTVLASFFFETLQHRFWRTYRIPKRKKSNDEFRMKIGQPIRTTSLPESTAYAVDPSRFSLIEPKLIRTTKISQIESKRSDRRRIRDNRTAYAVDPRDEFATRSSHMRLITRDTFGSIRPFELIARNYSAYQPRKMDRYPQASSPSPSKTTRTRSVFYLKKVNLYPNLI